MPLTALLKKAVPWKWSQKCIDAYVGVEHALTHAPVLQIPDHIKPFEVVCDASGYGLGAAVKRRSPQTAVSVKLERSGNAALLKWGPMWQMQVTICMHDPPC